MTIIALSLFQKKNNIKVTENSKITTTPMIDKLNQGFKKVSLSMLSVGAYTQICLSWPLSSNHRPLIATNLYFDTHSVALKTVLSQQHKVPPAESTEVE